MLRTQSKQQSIFSIIYNKIPEKHILKRIEEAVDFSFINVLLKKSYCEYYGRPAKEPEMMAKLVILQYLYDLSDREVIEEASLNIAYMWFLGINPEEDLPDPSLLSKFRTQRFKETTLDDIIKELVKQCVEKGIIKGTGVSVDSTHVEANTVKKVPERLMKHIAKKILKNVEEENGAIPEGLNTDIPNYKEIEDHKVAKATMKDYLENLMEEVESKADISLMPETEQVIEKAKEILSDPKFMEQKGVRSLVDGDARVGYKSKTDSFYGYKVEFTMLTKDRIITSVGVHDGAYMDGTEFERLYNQTKACGIKIEEVYGDKAYFRRPILDILKRDSVLPVIPVSECVYKLDESRFEYNKDSDQWICKYGNYTVKKSQSKRSNGGDILTYTFDKNVCKTCPERETCAGKKATSKRLVVSVNTPEYYQHSQWAKSEEFLEKYTGRAGHEGKNGEIKRFHGLDRARGYGLKSMEIQAKLAAIAVNLKRIANLVSSFCNLISLNMVKLCSFIVDSLKYLIKTT